MEIPLGENFGHLANVHVLYISNGGFNIPNSGLNTGNISLGSRSRFGRNTTSVTSGNATRHFTPLEGNSMEILAGLGRRGVCASYDGMFKSGIYAGSTYGLNLVIDITSDVSGVGLECVSRCNSRW